MSFAPWTMPLLWSSVFESPSHRPADEPTPVYGPTWPAKFDRERDPLGRAIDPWIIGGIHHVGCTAVCGLDGRRAELAIDDEIAA